MTKNLNDEIIEEIRRRREAHAESLDFDLKRIVEDLQRQEREAHASTIERAPRKPRSIPKRSSG